MKRCQSCGRGIERGTHCELSDDRLCGETARVEERARLSLAPGVLLKEDLVSVARQSGAYITATTFERECRKLPHDNVYGLLAFEQQHAEYLANGLFEPWRSRFLESCAEQRRRAAQEAVEDVHARNAVVLSVDVGALGSKDESVLTVRRILLRGETKIVVRQTLRETETNVWPSGHPFDCSCRNVAAHSSASKREWG